MKKILIISSSPRRNGNSFQCAEKMAEFLGAMDNETEILSLSEVNLENCRGCCTCLVNGEEFCPIKDDRKMLEDKISQKDAIIFIVPVYAMNMPAIMKNFMDRLAYTMHRPRFFSQKTMIASITGSIGTNEVIKSVSQLKYSGFNIIHDFGFVAPNPLFNPKLEDKNNILIKKQCEIFHKKLAQNKPFSPSFETLMQFYTQRKFFSRLKDKMPADWQYFNEKGWFMENAQYYVKPARIPLLKKIPAKILCRFM